VEVLDALPGSLETWAAAAGVLSLATLAGAAALLPWVVASLSEDHFVRSRAERRADRSEWAPRRVLAVVLRNVLGGLLLLAGIVMLFVPGQGLLTIVIALLVMDFPGKFRVEQALVRRRWLLRALNRLRAAAGRPPLRAPGRAEA
jgi:hypothetical protein